MGKHELRPDRIMWPTQDPDEDEKTDSHFPLPDVPPIVVPDL